MMTPTALLAASLLGTLAALPVSAQRSPLPPPGPIEHIEGNLYKIFGGGGNTLVFVQKDGVVLVDTKLPNNGQAILDQVRTVTDKPIVTIISTHNHPDHVGSTDFFREKFPSVQVVSQENTKTWVEKDPSHEPEVVPNVTYKDRLTIGAGDDRVELYYFGVAHTDGDAFVVIPAARAMFLGDVMAWNMAPLIDPPTGGSVIALPDALEKAAATVKGVDTVIEGHGNVNTWEGYLRFTRFNRALLSAARAAYRRGEPPAAAVAELERVPEFAPLLGTSLLPGLEYGNTP
ncbi:MAG TPA: MBL fold metallo-hydrolase, partial [Vicinamibacterales bacterium]|nr:MBL fold metallo-hydrolase [Vicinamibacterales bacterium]